MQSQTSLIKQNYSSAYGGSLLNTRKGRSRGRPISTKKTMHMVLRSSHARGKFSFRRPHNFNKINKIILKFSEKYGVKVLKTAMPGNHIHLHLKFSNRAAYKAFTRAITAAIAMAITGASRWRPISSIINGRFWDARPFTRIISGLRDFRNITNYIKLNQLESFGYSRDQAKYLLNLQWPGLNSS